MSVITAMPVFGSANVAACASQICGRKNGFPFLSAVIERCQLYEIEGEIVLSPDLAPPVDECLHLFVV